MVQKMAERQFALACQAGKLELGELDTIHRYQAKLRLIELIFVPFRVPGTPGCHREATDMTASSCARSEWDLEAAQISAAMSCSKGPKATSRGGN